EILMGLGYLCAWQANDQTMLWAMIILVSIGTGFFKGNVSGVNGRLFTNAGAEDQMDQAFNVQYSFVNIGSFTGTTFLSLIATMVSYRLTFLVCAILMFIDCAMWVTIGNKLFGSAGKKPFLVDKAKNADTEEKNDAPLTKLEKNRVIAILIVTVFSGIFWLLWYLVYLPVYYEFGPVEQGGLGWANWNIGSFQMPTAWFDSMNALICIGGAPIMGMVWAKLANRPKGDLSMWRKTALGIMILGLSLVVMVAAALLAGEGSGNPVGIWVIICIAFTLTLGELVFSPLGNSFINKYAPKKLLGTLLGVWPFIIFFSGKAYGPLYNWMCNFRFVTIFGATAAVIIAIGVIMWITDKKFMALMGEEE
ncbi:MAG: MFS transporter, partial [Dorea sp.]